MIVAEGLTRVFRTPRRQGFWRSRWEEKVAVADLNLDIPPGRITGLLGLNGAGKTTTIKMLATLLLPTSGSGSVDGLDLARDAGRIRRLVNIITGGERSLYWRLTARENLWYFGQLYDIEPRVLGVRIDELLELTGLREAADTPVERYSKGMKQRLQVARGLINQPRYLFMDEPTLGLDAPYARELRRMTSELAAVHGCGILLTSHYMFEVEELCQSLYVIDHGRLIARGTPAGLTPLGGVYWTALFLLAGNLGWLALRQTALRAALPGAAQVAVGAVEQGLSVTVKARADLTGPAVEVANRLGYRILRAESLEPSLEDAIVALTGQREVTA